MSTDELEALGVLEDEAKADSSDVESTIEVKKKPRAAKQIEAFKKVLAKRDSNRKARAEEAAALKAA